MKKLLFQLDTDSPPNIFDTVVAYDGGADHVTVLGNVNADNVAALADGAMFTRAPKNKKNTALFVTGSDMAAGEAVLAALTGHFFGNFRVSVMLDSNGSNTTAASAVAFVQKHTAIKGKKAVVLAGTGPVGQRAAVMLALEGAAEVVVTSRKLDRAQAACDRMGQNFGVSLTAAASGDDASVDALIKDANIVFATGAAGIQLLREEQWAKLPALEILVDANTVPPLGIEGIEMGDRGVERHGKICFGALGFGALKLELHRACVGRLFEANDQVFDAPTVFALAKEMVAER